MVSPWPSRSEIGTLIAPPTHVSSTVWEYPATQPVLKTGLVGVQRSLAVSWSYPQWQSLLQSGTKHKTIVTIVLAIDQLIIM